MARPKKTDTERRSFSVAFRCTASEMDKLTERAERVSQPVNAYARHACLASSVRVVKEQTLDFETRHELRAIGNNLNQIAHGLNAGRRHSPEKLENALERLHAFFDQVLPDDP